jgi:glutamine phosphoribosylpyrophosphate amidotransferase
MYPELKNRRNFIHDCWMIAKAKENDELKQAIISDLYFYLTREDLLVLIQTHDNTIITKILENKCSLHIQENIGYNLIKIKGTEVNKNQHTQI